MAAGLTCFSIAAAFAQVVSPDSFLGYELGTHYTPHHKIVGYFNAMAKAAPQQVKLEKYGETNEGKDLLIAIISSPANMASLEEIRKNNLRLTGILADKPGNINAPAIVWLSYNVHGNEPSSSEVAMKMLYELLNTGNAQTQEWLKNTVVIIDPCLNPDGRDRYVNWFNGIVGKQPDANPNSREHNEPWPGGRVNHYNYDLNRDWAWQTQVETQGRMKKYNEWMPQVHCDFHEQYPGNPYYFAPAAEPFHEVITPWQKSFQTTIGKNHAKYFDAKGWLYFTKEVFDLFYPAYGDTYPMYNGAIGMTYEQAGHSPGGLAIALGNDDTLTLKDRVAHHFTTGLSTVEVASQNNRLLLDAFKKYFDDGAAGIGEYKTYVITETNAGKRRSLQHFFDINGIRYGTINNSSLKGYNYSTGKEENFSAVNAIAVSSAQPKSAFVKVMFEPQSKLNDSVTYDITAWSLPYVYGVQSYAVKEKLPVGAFAPVARINKVPANAYAYLLDYRAFSDVKFLTSLLAAKIKVRFAEKEFSYGGKAYSKGTIIVLRKGNEERLDELAAMAEAQQVTITPISGGFMETGFDFGSDKVHLLKAPVVAMATGDEVNPNAAGEVWYLFEQELNYPLSLINASDLSAASLKDVDVLIMPDGNYKFFKDKDAAAEIKTWVQGGGRIVSLENATAQIARAEWGFKFKKEDEEKKDDKKDPYVDLKKYANRERDAITGYIPGAIYKVELDNTHPLAFGYNDQYFSLKLRSDIYEFMKDGWNVGVIKSKNPVAGFVGSKTKEKIKDGTVIGVQPMGSGSIVFFADDPIFRSFWESGKMLLANAVFLSRN